MSWEILLSLECQAKWTGQQDSRTWRWRCHYVEAAHHDQLRRDVLRCATSPPDRVLDRRLGRSATRQRETAKRIYYGHKIQGQEGESSIAIRSRSITTDATSKPLLRKNAWAASFRIPLSRNNLPTPKARHWSEIQSSNFDPTPQPRPARAMKKSSRVAKRMGCRKPNSRMAKPKRSSPLVAVARRRVAESDAARAAARISSAKPGAQVAAVAALPYMISECEI